MRAEFFDSFNLEQFILIAALPDMGRVGGLVSQHIAKATLAKRAVKITMSDKPWIDQKSGLVELPIDEYEIFVDTKNSLVILTGENQPQEPSSVFELVNFVINTTQKFGKIKMIISAGGYLPIQKTNSNGVFGIVTDSELLELLKSREIKLLPDDVRSITWFNGIILGAAKKNSIDGIGLFGEIDDSEIPQYRAVKNIIDKIESLLHIKINTNELQEKITQKPIEIKKDSPGIG